MPADSRNRLLGIVLCLCALLFLAGCTRQGAGEPPESLKEAYKDYNEGIAYDQAWQFRLAEMYYRKAYEAMKEEPSQDWFLYGDAGYRYAYMNFQRGDTEGAIAVMSDILTHDIRDYERSAILQLMGECQLQLGQHDAAKESFAKALEASICYYNGDNSVDRLNMLVSCFSIYNSFMEYGEYNEAAHWLDRMEKEFAVYEQMPDAPPQIIEEYKGHLALSHARLLLATGHVGEANAVYDAIPASRFFTPFAISCAAIWLSDAGRYGESADMYARLDTTYANASNAKMTFDKISECLASRYMANMKAGRTHEALAVGADMAGAIDSALAWQKRDDAAELSFIYQTHEKEIALEKSNAKAALFRLLAIAALLLLLLATYIIWRVRSVNRQLSEKNRSLYNLVNSLDKVVDSSRGREPPANQNPPPTQSQQLYLRLCELMQNPDVYTDADANHETLTRLLGTNRTYLADALHECADTTPTDFINKYRIHHAAQLLSTTDDPVGFIAEQCGFTNRSTFTRLFREHYSMTPTEYRKAAK